MLYSRSAEYAIRALVRLARMPQGQYTMAKDIAAMEEIPVHFLAKILQQLARRGWLHSCKGPAGGFMLRRDPGGITLFDIVKAMDALAPYQRCAGGFPQCSETMPCPLHESWSELHGRILKYLEQHTIGDLVKSFDAKNNFFRRSVAAAQRNPAGAFDPRSSIRFTSA